MPDTSINLTDEPLIQKDMEQLQLTDDQFKVRVFLHCWSLTGFKAFTWADICEIIGCASVRKSCKLIL